MQTWFAKLDADDARAWRYTAFVCFVSFAAFFRLVYAPLELIFDGDSYFHLAAAREYAQHGMLHALPWARFSIMHEGYGDKELLFHLALAPFSMSADAAGGAKLALALFDATLLTSVVVLAGRALGARGLAWATLLVFASGTLALRVIRLRPELLAATLLLWFCFFCARERFVAAAICAWLYALSYTALQALLGLSVLWFAWALVVERRREVRLLVYPFGAVAVGVLMHPQFPANVRVWVVQNIEFWRHKSHLPVGTEIQPFTTAQWLSYDFGLMLGIAGLCVCSRPGATARTGREAAYFTFGACVFGLLFLEAARFATFFVPFALASVFFELRRRGLRPSRDLVVLHETKLPSLLVVFLTALGVMSVTTTVRDNLAEGGMLSEVPLHNLRALGRRLPENAKVAATWGAATGFVYWAPQARFLNVLDPVFMFVAHPALFALQQSLFDGEALDVPLRLREDLDSDYLAFGAPALPALAARVRKDPRCKSLVDGPIQLFHNEPGSNTEFVLDWQLTRSEPAGLAKSVYPRARTAAGRALEGYVDLARVPGAGGRCTWLEHRMTTALAEQASYELGATGPVTLWFDGTERVQVASGSNAIIGEGTRLAIDLAAGEHAFVVRACPKDGKNMFFLRRTR